MGVYDTRPERFLVHVVSLEVTPPQCDTYCAGFELKKWRYTQFADHLIEWLPEYALPEPELMIHHGNAYTKLKEAAVRIYTSAKYENRGEVGEIALHAICREFFGTIPISPRVFYKSASNDVIKSFDLVHARIKKDKSPEIWLGESKLYSDSAEAIASAIDSVRLHLDQGFLQNQKLLIGPQIPPSTPNYQQLRGIFKSQASLDELLAASMFVIGILSDSAALKAATTLNSNYAQEAMQELAFLAGRLAASGLTKQIRITLVYVPLNTKRRLVAAFDARLKGLQ